MFLKPKRLQRVFPLTAIAISILAGSCGITRDRYIRYESEGAAAATICGDALKAYTTHLNPVFNLANCACHINTLPVVANKLESDSLAFVLSAQQYGGTQELVNFLISPQHTGRVEAINHQAALNAWAEECSSAVTDGVSPEESEETDTETAAPAGT